MPQYAVVVGLQEPHASQAQTNQEPTLYSRRRNILNGKFPYIAAALMDLPDATVIDGELVALDAEGRSDFALLQNFRSAEKQIHHYAFDILIYRGKLLIDLPLAERQFPQSGCRGCAAT